VTRWFQAIFTCLVNGKSSAFLPGTPKAIRDPAHGKGWK
jgi:hypothetical protein